MIQENVDNDAGRKKHSCEFCPATFGALWRLIAHREDNHREEISKKVGDPFARFERRYEADQERLADRLIDERDTVTRW